MITESYFQIPKEQLNFPNALHLFPQYMTGGHIGVLPQNIHNVTCQCGGLSSESSSTHSNVREHHFGPWVSKSTVSGHFPLGSLQPTRLHKWPSSLKLQSEYRQKTEWTQVDYIIIWQAQWPGPWNKMHTTWVCLNKMDMVHMNRYVKKQYH